MKYFINVNKRFNLVKTADRLLIDNCIQYQNHYLDYLLSVAYNILYKAKLIVFIVLFIDLHL
jgi:hypothetical protein